MIKRADQVSAGDNADDLVGVRVQNRNLSPTAGRHTFFEFGDRIIRIDADRAGKHQISSVFFEFVGNRAIHIASGEQPYQLFFIHHWITFKSITFHQLRRVCRTDVRAKRQRVLGHHLAYFDARSDYLGDGFDHSLGNFREPGVGDINIRTPFFANQRRRGPLVSATAKMNCQLRHIHVIRGGAGYQANSLPGGDKQHQPVWRQEFAHLMGYRGDLVVEVVSDRLGNQDAVAFDIQLNKVLQQAVIELLLGI